MSYISTMTFNLTTANHSQINGTPFYPDYNEDYAKEVYQSPIGIIRLCLCATGLVLNFLSVIAVAHIPLGITTHLKLILSLGLSDTLIIISMLFNYLHLLLPVKSTCFTLWVRQSLNMSILATLINLLAMAVDHYIAIMKPLRYPQIMTTFRGNCLILFVWFISILVGSLDYLVAVLTSKGDTTIPTCYRASMDEFDSELVILGFTLLVFLIMMTVYTKIYLVVRKLMSDHRTLTQDETHNYKAIITTFLILGTFILCWIPHCIFQIIMNAFINTNKAFLSKYHTSLGLVDNILFLLLLSNSLCDPIIYAVRLGQVQNGYKRMLFKYFPRYRRSLNELEFRILNSKSNADRRSTSATLMMDTETSDRKKHHKISDTDITLVPFPIDYPADISNSTTDSNSKIETVMKADDYLQNDDLGSSTNWTNRAVNFRDSVDGTGTGSSAEFTEEEIPAYKAKTMSPAYKEDDNTSGITITTPVSLIQDKDFWDDTEVSNLLNKP